MSQAKNEYDDIAEAYRDSKQLSFRKYLEEYSLFEMLGKVRGKSVLDLACGEGFYTRKIEFKNFYLAPETYQWAFQEAGFADFKWVDLHLAPIQQDNLFWDEFLSNPPLIGFMAFKR